MKYLSVAFLLIMTACSLQPEENKESAYFDVNGLLQQAEENIQGRNIRLQKRVVYEHTTADTLLQLDKAGLQEEMDVFREMDINQPVFSGRYRMDTFSEAGLKKLRYSADAPEKMNIDTLEVWLDKNDAATYLRAHFSDRNLLYQSKRELQLWLTAGGEPQRYRISGRQHMIFQDTVHYQVDAAFLY